MAAQPNSGTASAPELQSSLSPPITDAPPLTLHSAALTGLFYTTITTMTQYATVQYSHTSSVHQVFIDEVISINSAILSYICHKLQAI